MDPNDKSFGSIRIKFSKKDNVLLYIKKEAVP